MQNLPLTFLNRFDPRQYQGLGFTMLICFYYNYAEFFVWIIMKIKLLYGCHKVIANLELGVSAWVTAGK